MNNFFTSHREKRRRTPSHGGWEHGRRIGFEALEARHLLAAIAINTGGSTEGDFSGDQFFTGGKTFSTSDSIDLSGVTNAAPEQVYKSERSGQGGSDFVYNFGGLIVGQTYEVRLHFAEIYWNDAGKRSFDVLINGTQVLDDYDVYVEAGNAADTAVIEEFVATANTSGEIVIDFVTEVNNAKVSAIEIIGEVPPAFEWTEVAPAPLPTYEGQGTGIGDKLYVTGGFFTGGLSTTVETHAYDPATNTWEQRADAPQEITHGGQAVDGDKFYIVGGFVGSHPGGSSDKVWIYDTVADEWLPGPDLPADRGGGGTAVVGRSLHFFSGATRTAGINVLVDHPEHWVLDLGPTDSPLDDATTWVPAAELPNPRNHMAGVAIDGLVYAVGGQHGGNENSGNQDDLHVYDPATNEWTQLADMPLPLGHITASTFVVNGKIIVIAGVTQSSEEVDTVFSYDPFTDVWSELPSIPSARQSPVAGLVGDQIVVTVGSSGGIQDETWVANVASSPRVLFVRGADRSGGFLEAGNDTARTEQLADINNFATNGGNHGWGELRSTLEAAGFAVEQLAETAENASGPSDGIHIDFERMDLSRFDAIVFGSNNAVYDTAAVDAIEDYVRGGGSTLFISDANFGGDWADASNSDQQFLDRFGLIMHQDQGTYTISRSSGDFAVPDHPIFEGVNSFDGEGVTPIEVGTLTSGVSATILANSEGNTRLNEEPFGSNNQGPSRPSGPQDAALVVATADAGKVVGHFDRNTFFNLNGAGTSINRLDNEQYAINLFTWLVTPRAGNYNGDTVVDELDHTQWAAQFGTTGGSADGNGDGVVNVADYNTWRDNLTPASLGSLSSSLLVGEDATEPTSLVLGGLALVAESEPTTSLAASKAVTDSPRYADAVDRALLLLGRSDSAAYEEAYSESAIDSLSSGEESTDEVADAGGSLRSDLLRS